MPVAMNVNSNTPLSAMDGGVMEKPHDQEKALALDPGKVALSDKKGAVDFGAGELKQRVNMGVADHPLAMKQQPAADGLQGFLAKIGLQTIMEKLGLGGDKSSQETQQPRQHATPRQGGDANALVLGMQKVMLKMMEMMQSAMDGILGGKKDAQEGSKTPQTQGSDSTNPLKQFLEMLMQRLGMSPGNDQGNEKGKTSNEGKGESNGMNDAMQKMLGMMQSMIGFIQSMLTGGGNKADSGQS